MASTSINAAFALGDADCKSAASALLIASPRDLSQALSGRDLFEFRAVGERFDEQRQVFRSAQPAQRTDRRRTHARVGLDANKSSTAERAVTIATIGQGIQAGRSARGVELRELGREELRVLGTAGGSPHLLQARRAKLPVVVADQLDDQSHQFVGLRIGRRQASPLTSTSIDPKTQETAQHSQRHAAISQENP